MAKGDTLTAKQVEKLSKQAGTHGVAKNLLLQSNSTSASWVGRHQIKGRTWWPGYGSYPEVSLADALEKRDADRSRIRKGFDPWEEKDRERAEKEAEGRPRKKFEDLGEQFVADNERSWMNPAHRAQWKATLRTYVFPVLGAKWTDEVTTDDVLKVLRPLWFDKPETAHRVRGRIERIWDVGKVLGFCSGENPARLSGNIAVLLPKPVKKKIRVKHHPALPYAQMPAFMAALRGRDGTAARALEFLILTWTRTGDVRGQEREDRPPMMWKHVDLDARIWTIPATKTSQQHKVPLSDAAIAVVERMKGIDATIVFPSPDKPGKPLSNGAMLRLLQRMGYGHVTTHGMRSAARDWAAECTNTPNEVCEMALAHAIESDVEASYRRGDLFVKRRRLMAEWADFCAGTPAAVAAE